MKKNLKAICLASAIGVSFFANSFVCQASINSVGSFGTTYTEDFDTLANTGTSSTLPAGWAISEGGTGANTTYAAGTGSSATGDTYSFGSASSTDRALGGLQSGSLVPTFGVQILNNAGGTLGSLVISYTGEEWRTGGNGSGRGTALDRLDFQYSTDATSLTTGTWIDFNALDFISPVIPGAAGALDGNAVANRSLLSATINGLSVGNGNSIWLRWNDFNVTGSDDGLAVDDFSVSGVAASTPVPEPGEWGLISAFGLLGMCGVSIWRSHCAARRVALVRL